MSDAGLDPAPRHERPSSAPRLAAVVLAAGASVRMGSPKPLLTWRGRSVLEHVVALAEVAVASPIIVVEGAHPLPRLRDTVLAHNEDWRQGPLSSLQTGLRDGALGGAAGVLVLTVDRPHLQRSTVEALQLAWSRAPNQVWQPTYRGTHGHPIIYPPDLVDDLLALPSTSSARELLARSEIERRRAFLEVDDAAVVDNIDTPEAFARLP